MTTRASNNVDLSGHVALVTGGGRGLGRAFAQALSISGAVVAVTARSEDQLAATVELIESSGGRALAIAGDASDPQRVEQAVATVEAQIGPVDILVNNAGVPGEIKEEWLTDPEEWWRTLEVNLRGPYMFIRRALPGMIERHRGRIINILQRRCLGNRSLYRFLYNVKGCTVTVFEHPGKAIGRHRGGRLRLSRIHRRTGMDDVRTAEGGEGVTGVMIRARIWVDGRLAGGLQALLGAPMAAYSGCGEPDGGIGHGKRRSRTGLARVCGDVGLAGGSVADGLRQAGSGMARSRARARLNCSSQGQRRGSCRVNRRAERVIRPAKAKPRRLRVLVVTIC